MLMNKSDSDWTEKKKYYRNETKVYVEWKQNQHQYKQQRNGNLAKQ